MYVSGSGGYVTSISDYNHSLEGRPQTFDGQQTLADGDERYAKGVRAHLQTGGRAVDLRTLSKKGVSIFLEGIQT